MIISEAISLGQSTPQGKKSQIVYQFDTIIATYYHNKTHPIPTRKVKVIMAYGLQFGVKASLLPNSRRGDTSLTPPCKYMYNKL